jgi:putative hydrolase of the HAD superfamily
VTAQYQSALKSALRLKPGAKELLQHLHAHGKKIIVITEGPRDAQEWTIELLGLKEYVDVLATSSEFGKSKVDGLFLEVLIRYHINPKEMVFVGDNLERDVMAAREVGISAVLYDENCEENEREDGIVCEKSLGTILGEMREIFAEKIR